MGSSGKTMVLDWSVKGIEKAIADNREYEGICAN